jgi:ribonuclease P protein component
LKNLKRFKLEKFNRIKSKKLFQAVYKNGHSVVDTLSVLYILPSDTTTVKIGLAVGKKVGNAVVRNHVKRLMREVFRVKKNDIKKNVNIVWVARKRLVTADIKIYERVFLRLAKRAGLL